MREHIPKTVEHLIRFTITVSTVNYFYYLFLYDILYSVHPVLHALFLYIAMPLFVLLFWMLPIWIARWIEGKQKEEDIQEDTSQKFQKELRAADFDLLSELKERLENGKIQRKQILDILDLENSESKTTED